MLDQLAQKMMFDGIDQDSDVSLTAQTYELLDSIGDIPFACKILS